MSFLSNFWRNRAANSGNGYSQRRYFNLSLKKAANILFLCVVVLNLNAGTYYIDFVGGSDANNGTSKATAWKRHPMMSGFSGSYSHTAGDQFYFKGGVTWSGCFPMNINVSGTSGNRDYYGVDKTWYSGAEWTRPVFDANYTSTTCVNIGTVSYLTLDGIEFKNMQNGSSIWATAPNYTTLTNLYIHKWYKGGASEDGSMGGIYNNFGGASIGRRTLTEFRITGCVIDNSDGDANAGVCVRGVGELDNCFLASAPELQLHGGYAIWNNVFSNVTESFKGDAAQHPNATYIDNFNGIEDYSGHDIYFYNNLFINIRGGGAVQLIYPNFGSGGLSSYADFWCFNNVIVNCPNTRTIPIEHEFMSGGFVARYHFFNNTFENNQSGGGIISFVNRSGVPAPSLIEMVNNHFIGAATIYVPYGTSSTVSHHNLTNTLTTANTARYLTSSYYAPSSGGQPTVGTGTNLSALSLTALNSGTTRGRQLAAIARGATWDIGAYEYDAGGGGGSGGGLDTEPVIMLSPNSFDFGSFAVGDSAELNLVIRNVGGGTLAGSVDVLSPFSVVSGGSYKLGSNQAQTVTFRFAPSNSGNYNQVATFSGGDGASVNLSGAAWAILPGLTFESTAGTITAPFAVNGGGYVSQADETLQINGGRAVYGFRITSPGDYRVSALVNCPTDAANSFFINIDAEPVDPSMVWDVLPLTGGFESRTASWRGSGTFDNPQYPSKIFNLSDGTHHLIIRGREAGAQIGRITIEPIVATAVPRPPSSLQVVGP